MPRPTASLTNCYTPSLVQPTQPPQPTSPTKKKKAAASWTRRDFRAPHSLRQLVIQSQAAGATNDYYNSSSSSASCLVEWGHTKVSCHVWAPLYASNAAPQIMPPGVQLSMDQGTLHCAVKYAGWQYYAHPSLESRRRTMADSTNNAAATNRQATTWMMTRETELASGLHTALSAAVPLEPYPKACLAVHVTILQDDGSVLPACIAAATVALARARVTLLDTVTACSVAVVGSNDDDDDDADDSTDWWADPTHPEETIDAKAVVTLAWLPNSKQVTLWEQQGPLDAAETNRAMDLCRDGCRTLQRFVRQHLVEEFAKEEQVAAAGEDEDAMKTDT